MSRQYGNRMKLIAGAPALTIAIGLIPAGSQHECHIQLHPNSLSKTKLNMSCPIAN